MLGSRTAEELEANMLITVGLKVSTPANVSSMPITCICMTKQRLISVFLFVSLTNAHIINDRTSNHGKDDQEVRMPQMRYCREIWLKQLLRSRRFLVQKMRRCW